MNKVIRWQGLLAFIIVLGLITVPVYLFSDSIVKSLIEKQGSNLVGAKVDVRDVKLSLSPAGVVIRGLDVADADEPMTNIVSIDSIYAQFDLLKAFMGQVIIKDASVNGMEFGTARKVSGALKKKPKPEPKEPSFIAQQIDAMTQRLPDGKEALQREPLLMDQRHKELEDSVALKQKLWQELEQAIPDKQTLDGYKERIAALQNTKPRSVQDLKALNDELKAIQQAIRDDKETMQKAKAFIGESSKQLADELKALKDAPKEDRDRLLSKYTLDESGLANLSGLLFGADIQEKVETALYWYEKVAPFLASDDDDEEEKRQRATGRFVLFPEAKPYPSFLIEKMAASARLPAGDVSATANDITHQQYVQNRPTTLHIGSEVLRDVKRLDVNAVFDYRNKNAGVSVADFVLQQLEMKDYSISSSKDLPIKLEQAVAEVNGQLKLEDGRLSGQMQSDFNQAQFASFESSGILQYLNQAFAEIHSFDLHIALAGSLRNPRINVNSNIDRQLKNSVERQMKEQVEAFRRDIEQQLNERLDGYLAKLNMPGFDDEEKSLEEKIKGLDKLLEAKLEDYKEQQKQEAQEKVDKAKEDAKSKAKDKLKSRLKF